MTVMPVIGWNVPGGMRLSLDLYHNSQDNLDIGWGMNWRSSFDMRFIYTGTSSDGNYYQGTMSYPDGKRLVFKCPIAASGGTQSNRFYPPNGFYDMVFSSYWIQGRSTQQFFTMRTKDQTVYSFNAAGYLTQITDRYGNSISVTRASSNNFVTAVSDAAGNQLTFTSGITSTTLTPHYQSVTTPTRTVYNFNVVSQSYNPNLNILRSVQFPAPLPGGETTTESFGYDLGAAILSEVARDGSSYKFTYDSTERLTSFAYNVPFYANPFQPTSNPPYLSYSYSYGTSSTTFTDPYSKTFTDNYSSGLLQSVVDQAGYSDDRTYDAYYNLSQYKNQRQNVSYLGYDAYGNLIQSQDSKQYAAGVSQQLTYNSYNDVLTATDTRGAVTTYNRDPNSGCVLSVVDGLGNTLVTNTYNSAGQLLTSSADGATTTVTYDGWGRPTSVQMPDQTYTVAYNRDFLPNLPYTITDSLGNIITLSLDAWGRSFGITRSADGQTSSITLDALSRATASTDWLGHSDSVMYDQAGRVTGVTNARGDTQNFTWYDIDRLAGVQDGNGHTRTYSYTVRGEAKGFMLADGDSEVYQFDGDGNQTSRSDGLFQVTGYGYDVADNLVSTTYPDGTGTSASYDNDGRSTSMVDATGTTSWVYDFANRLTNFNSPQGNLSYTYDQWGRRTKLSEPNSVSIQYGYTAQRLTSITKLPENEVTSFTYDSVGRLKTQNNSNGTVATYGYDALGRLASLVHSTSAGINILSDAYTYDYNGNLVSKLSNGVTTPYTYDNVGQLVNEGPGQFTAGNIHYTYDANGNRTSKTVQGSYAETYNYDAGDKLFSVYRNNILYKSYGYDAAGRTTSVQTANSTTNLAYDYQDRVTSITGLPVTNSFTYNALDARASKTDSTGTSTYLRDGEDPSDAVLNDGSAVYTPGIARHTSAGTHVSHPDYLGTNRAETDSAQTVQGTRTYDAFGGAASTTGMPSGPFGYAGSFGYQEDGDTSLKLLGHRFYDSTTARLVTRDPSKHGRNWYSYAENSPTRFIDHTGNMSEEAACAAELAEDAADPAIFGSEAGGDIGAGDGVVLLDQNGNPVFECIRLCLILLIKSGKLHVDPRIATALGVQDQRGVYNLEYNNGKNYTGKSTGFYKWRLGQHMRSDQAAENHGIKSYSFYPVDPEDELGPVEQGLLNANGGIDHPDVLNKINAFKGPMPDVGEGIPTNLPISIPDPVVPLE